MYNEVDIIGILVIPVCIIVFLLICTYELVGDLSYYKKRCKEYEDKEINYINNNAKLERVDLYINSMIKNLQEIKEDINNGKL